MELKKNSSRLQQTLNEKIPRSDLGKAVRWSDSSPRCGESGIWSGRPPWRAGQRSPYRAERSGPPPALRATTGHLGTEEKGDIGWRGGADVCLLLCTCFGLWWWFPEHADGSEVTDVGSLFLDGHLNTERLVEYELMKTNILFSCFKFRLKCSDERKTLFIGETL